MVRGGLEETLVFMKVQVLHETYVVNSSTIKALSGYVEFGGVKKVTEPLFE